MDQVTVPRATVQQALDACTAVVFGWRALTPLAVRRAAAESLDDLRAALEQPEQATPVAWIDIEEDGTCHSLRYWSEPGRREHALYPHPPRRDTGQKPVAWMYVAAHEPLNRHLEWTEDRKGYRGDWIKTPLYEAKQQQQPEQENPTRQMPEWMDYDQATDVLTIHGRRYSAAMFGERGFLSPAGTLLQVAEGQPDCVTLMTILPTEPK
jgi:hypothetical protein